MVFSPPADQRQIITPTSLNRMVRTLLSSEIGLVWLSAEISNFVAASSGHWYFTLKDNKAQVKAAMFKQANRYIKPMPKQGDKVLVRASVGLYEPRGDYQLIVEHMESEGEGKLKIAFEQLKNQLNREGLFALEAKRPLPDSIKTIGVITSASGAALHDVLSVLNRRSPDTRVVVYPTLVQGEQAAMGIRQALHTANQRREVDVLLLTRGGGSMEDLWSFNDEGLARDIAASELVVVSAVGHEVDITISDYVADLRAPTPSAAAELLSQDKAVRLRQVNHLSGRLTQLTLQMLARKRQQQQATNKHLLLLHPTRQLQQQAQQLDMLRSRLESQMANTLGQQDASLRTLIARFKRLKPNAWVDARQQQQALLVTRLRQSWDTYIESKQQRLQNTAGHLHAISPLATMARGYSIALQNGEVLSSVEQVDSTQPITTRLVDGEVVSQPTHKTKME